jgi:hypothetical protein
MLPELTGKTVILVDEGLASGFTMMVAFVPGKKRAAAGTVVAVPTALRRCLATLGEGAGQIYCANIWAPRLGFSQNLFELGREDEIVLRQPADLVSPSAHLCPAPTQVDVRVVPLAFGKLADPVREARSVAKIGEAEEPLEMMLLHHIPSAVQLRQQGLLLASLQGRNSTPAGNVESAYRPTNRAQAHFFRWPSPQQGCFAPCVRKPAYAGNAALRRVPRPAPDSMANVPRQISTRSRMLFSPRPLNGSSRLISA